LIELLEKKLNKKITRDSL